MKTEGFLHTRHTAACTPCLCERSCVCADVTICDLARFTPPINISKHFGRSPGGASVRGSSRSHPHCVADDEGGCCACLLPAAYGGRWQARCVFGQLVNYITQLWQE